MAFYRQNEGNYTPVNGTAPCRDYYPLSYTVYGPAAIPEAMTNPGSTQPSGGFRANPVYTSQAGGNFGQHDALKGAIMRSAQADYYNSEPCPFPANGVWDQPGAGLAAAGGFLRLAPTTSAHPGLTNSSGAGPTMIFTAPPVFTFQTTPIIASGL